MHKKGSFLIAMGLLLLAAALLLTGYNIWDGMRADAAAQSAVKELRTLIPNAQTAETELQPTAPEALHPAEGTEAAPAISEETAPTESAPPEIPGHRDMPTVEVNGYRYIGMLEVPSLELTLPVMEQWDYDRLNISPCRFSGNVYDDDLVICGHNYPHHFQPLKYVPIGTQLKFTDAEGNDFYYAVTSIETIGPNDVQAMTTGDWDLTLFTCNTSGQTRCTIRCERLGK